MKLTSMTQVTIDGVMQGNGAASDDRRNGFERGGWAMGVFNKETTSFINRTYQRADAFLFGRRTYDFFAGYWGAMGPGSGPIANALNTLGLGLHIPTDLPPEVARGWWLYSGRSR